MKKGYIRLLVFEFIIAIILFLNSFVWNILSKHFMNVFLLIVILLFRVFFGLEKDRHRYVKDVLMDVFIFLLVSLMLYYLLGIVISFAKIDNYYSINGLINYIIPAIMFVIFREYLRYNILCKAEGSKLAIVCSILLFIFISISTDIYYEFYNNTYGAFRFIALILLPAISSNIVYSAISMNVGYKPVMLYSLVMSLYIYFIPIIPNPSEYVKSVIDLLLPFILSYRIYIFMKKTRDEDIDRNYNKRRYGWLALSCFIVVGLVYFTSGYFNYWAIAVASGSMSPSINKGDVVVIKKVKDVSKIKKGSVLAFRYSNVTIVHRIINIAVDDDKYYFYTKGDANHDEDNFVIEEDMILGVVSVKVPFIGNPTVWLSEL